MRDEVREPELDPDTLAAALRLADEIYCLHEAGSPYADQLARLAGLTGEALSGVDACAAFGSVDPDTWVCDLLLMRHPCPTDLSDAELIELLAAICACDGEEWQMSWWLRCVAASTGCKEVSGLVFHPQEMLGPADGREELTPEEILVEARRYRRRVLVTPPPSDDAA